MNKQQFSKKISNSLSYEASSPKIYTYMKVFLFLAISISSVSSLQATNSGTISQPVNGQGGVQLSPTIRVNTHSLSGNQKIDSSKITWFYPFYDSTWTEATFPTITVFPIFDDEDIEQDDTVKSVFSAPGSYSFMNPNVLEFEINGKLFPDTKYEAKL